ncbi:hypothetical protein [Moraxella cuniculi]|uniref:Uncharacterized protein n=1 Tax=Moraxella cuniculi TaxID=34061 RepID=A0A3S4T044_9GAMM|nr:hypothetical protein [Moraxella cuniculi]VEG13735.1 Uncharacterised protein [Moraxella cuniculi]
MAKVIQDYLEVGAILDAYQKGEYHNLTLSQEALQALADATGVSTEVLLTSITAHQGIQGATNKELTVIDIHDELRQDSIQTLAHELDHVRGDKNKTLADLAGLAAKLNTEAAISANKDKINPIKAQLGDGKDTQTTLQNQAILDENKAQLEGEKESDGVWSYEASGINGEACTGVECSDRQIIAQLNACKRDASQCRDYPEHLKVAASILAPTTKEEVAFIVATAGGGYV